MAPRYSQMNTAQRASRKQLISQVSGLLAKKRFPQGTVPRPAQTPNYRNSLPIVRFPVKGRGKKRVGRGGYGQRFNPQALS